MMCIGSAAAGKGFHAVRAWMKGKILEVRDMYLCTRVANRDAEKPHPWCFLEAISLNGGPGLDRLFRDGY